MIGRFAISKAGHDKGKIYVVVSLSGDSVYLSDGRLKKQDAPKKKNRKHIQLTGSSVDQDLMEALQNGTPHLDDRIRYAVKRYGELITNTGQNQ